MMDAGNSSSKGSKCFISSRSLGWTNERHLRFLNSIEASFVRAMFENINYYYYDNNNYNNNGLSSTSDLRLDRHIPDSSESTQDLLPKLRRRRTFSTNSTSPDAEEERTLRAPKKNKGLLSNDQVVPQIEIKKGY